MRDTAPYGPNDQDEIRNGVDAVWSRSAENASQLSFLVNSLPKPSTKYYVGSFERLASVDGPVASGDFNTHALPNDPSGSPETIVGE